MSKPGNQLPTDEEMKNAAGVILDPESGQPIIIIPPGKLTTEKLQSLLPAGASCEVLVKPPNTPEFHIYSVVETPFSSPVKSEDKKNTDNHHNTPGI